jgi:predicted nucleic acid-binding protein
MQSPERLTWLNSEHICQNGHEKSGYPTMYDSIYHAMAILNEGIFITSDKRHYEKAKTFGYISLLKDWESALGK